MTTSPSKLAPTATQKVTLTITKGPNRGDSFQLLPPKVTIGRGSGNDIALSDVKCSRNQAILHVSPPRYFIEDISSRGTTLVNGKTSKVTELRDGDTISVGESELSFKIEALGFAPPSLRVETGVSQVSWNQPSQSVNSSYKVGPSPQARTRSPKGSGNRVRFYGTVAVIGAALYFLLSGEAAKKPDIIALRSPEEIEKDLEKTQEKLIKLAELRQYRNPEEQQRFQESHQHYLTGFRDYQKGQYARALRAFETARAIDPSHELANRYAVLAERKRDEWITRQMMEGRRYLEKSMFSRCSAALDKVMDEIANPQDLKFKEAQALKAECELMRRRKY